MASALEIRKRIHDFADIADERILRIINGIIDVEEQEDDYPAIPDWHYDEINER